jgi:hypothetical protein
LFKFVQTIKLKLRPCLSSNKILNVNLILRNSFNEVDSIKRLNLFIDLNLFINFIK